MSSTKTKLLFITDWYAPAFKGGGPIRSVVNLIEKIKKDYDCYVYTSNTDFGEVEPLAGIVADQSIRIAGDVFTSDIVDFMKKKYNLLTINYFFLTSKIIFVYMVIEKI